MSQDALIEGLKSKVSKVVEDNRRLRDQNVQLRRDAERLRNQRAELQRKTADLERRISVLEISASMGGTAEQKKLARARVNRLMREVDRCIALING